MRVWLRESDAGLVDRRVIIETFPSTVSCRLPFVWTRRKTLYHYGDATERELAQRLDSLAGKTLRLNDDGRCADNPFVGKPMRVPRLGPMEIGMAGN